MAYLHEFKLPDYIVAAHYPQTGLDALDAQSNVFFARELEHIIPEIFMREHARINARAVFPIYRGASPFDKQITYRQFTKVGAAKIISDYANDIPLVNVFGEEFTGNVRTLGCAARWSVDEIGASAQHGRGLDRMQVDTARETILRLENDIAWNGDADNGLVGLLTDPNIPQTTVVNPGGGTQWSTKTGLEMVADMCACADAIPQNTGDVEMPTRLLIASRAYRIAKCTHVNAGGSTVSALKWFLDNHDTVTEVMPIRELEGVGAGGTDMMIAYTPDQSKLRMNVTLELEQRPPQEVDLWVKVIYREKFGGVTVHKPMSLHKCDGL